MTRECVALKNYTQIEKLLKLIGEDFVSSHNPNTRKGALVGLAAIAIALNKVIKLTTKERYLVWLITSYWLRISYRSINFILVYLYILQETDRYTNELVKPILICMSDTDSRVRYYACESLYNVTKGKLLYFQKKWVSIFWTNTIIFST